MPKPSRKLPLDVQSLARSYTKLSIETLGGIAAAGESESARVAACGMLLDRGWGKALQQLTGEDDGDIRVTIRNIVESRDKD